jgi:hypothetical protein
MPRLPLNLTLPQTQTQWSGILNPVIANPIVNGLALTNVALIDGTTIINHTLARKMQGWFVTDINGAATIYRPALSPLNSQTLTLVSSAIVTVNLWVY